MRPPKRYPKPPFFQRQGRSLLQGIALSLVGLFVGSFLFHFLIILPTNQNKPIDGFLVLGGHIQREVYAAELAQKFPDVPILISGGTLPPCAHEIFSKRAIPVERVVVEPCAQSTFDNFLFSVPILKKWKVHHIKLITSPDHLPRAKWLADILLGSQGIAVQVDIETESYRIGVSTESAFKSFLDVSRALFFALLGQVWTFSCDRLQPLDQLDITNPSFSPENWPC
ncbi:MAG: YdcF family protein [Microcystaceae cyanobacterium]